jgi:very-short-patch-repair endonuclease
MALKRVHLDTDDLVQRYLAGESEKALAESLSVSRPTIRRHLIEAGVEPRGRSDAMYLRMGKTKPEERKRLASAAHAARRGYKCSPEELAERAKAIEINARGNISPAEEALANALRNQGVEVVQQKAIGPYNVDVAADSVAVEILGGQWHRARRHGKRLRHILDAGWDVIYIWVDGVRFPLGPGAAEYVIAHLQFRNGNPAAPRCYRVIRGTGEFLTGGGPDSDHLPDILPNTGRPDVAPPEVPYGFCHCGCSERTMIATKTSTAKGWVKGRPKRFINGHNSNRPRHTN